MPYDCIVFRFTPRIATNQSVSQYWPVLLNTILNTFTCEMKCIQIKRLATVKKHTNLAVLNQQPIDVIIIAYWKTYLSAGFHDTIQWCQEKKISNNQKRKSNVIIRTSFSYMCKLHIVFDFVCIGAQCDPWKWLKVI